MIELYGHGFSSNSRKVHWALEEANAAYDYVTVDIMQGEQKSPDFLEENPNGRVPVLVDGELSIYESNAILLYLADRFDDSVIGLRDPHRRGLIYQWCFWQASDLAAAILEPWLMNFMASMDQPADPEMLEVMVAGAGPPLQVLEHHLRGRNFMVDDFSVADIAIAESIGLCEDAGLSLEACPGISSWYERTTARGAWARSRPD
jgi:glutathione S-transferase